MDPMSTDVTAHLTTGAVVVYLLEWLKKTPWCRWIHDDSGILNRVLSASAAAAMAFGIQATGDAQVGWTITVPSLSILMLGVWGWAKQFVTQQVLYDTILAPRRIKETQSGPIVTKRTLAEDERTE